MVSRSNFIVKVVFAAMGHVLVDELVPPINDGRRAYSGAALRGFRILLA
jgi:hypothetical protein